MPGSFPTVKAWGAARLAIWGILIGFSLACAVVAATGSYPAYLAALAQRESGGNPAAKNRYGYLGLYQMGEAALIEAGYYQRDGTRRNDWRGAWTGQDGIHSVQDFLNHPEAQTQAVTAYHIVQWRSIQALGLDRYPGQSVGGVRITPAGLLAGAHLVGVGGLQRFLTSGGKASVTDGNGTSIASYLSQFGGYDVGAITGVTPVTPVTGGIGPTGGGSGVMPAPAARVIPIDPDVAFASGAGVTPMAVRAAILQVLAVLLLLWTAGVALMQCLSWRRGQISLMAVQSHIVTATVVTLVVLFVTQA